MDLKVSYLWWYAGIVFLLDVILFVDCRFTALTRKVKRSISYDSMSVETQKTIQAYIDESRKIYRKSCLSHACRWGGLVTALVFFYLFCLSLNKSDDTVTLIYLVLSLICLCITTISILRHESRSRIKVWQLRKKILQTDIENIVLSMEQENQHNKPEEKKEAGELIAEDKNPIDENCVNKGNVDDISFVSSKGVTKQKRAIKEIKTVIFSLLPQTDAVLQKLLDGVDRVDAEIHRQTGLDFHLGQVKDSDNKNHTVALFLQPNSNSLDDNYIKRLMRTFSGLKYIFICGIASGIPQKEHIGDVVVSEKGVIQYILGTREKYTEILCHDYINQTVNAFSVTELDQNSKWKTYIDVVGKRLGGQYARSPQKESYYVRDVMSHKYIKHIEDCPPLPATHLGRIATGCNNVQNPEERDDLLTKGELYAIVDKEIRIQQSSYPYDIGILMICGISDFCDVEMRNQHKYYAATTAAAYTRGLLESMQDF